jgi:hypothetical protein
LKTLPIESLTGKFISLNPGTDQIGIWGWSRIVGELPTFTFGTLDEDQKFVIQGAISEVDPRTDLPVIFPNRLLTAASDHVAIYDLIHSGKSLWVEYESTNTSSVAVLKHNSITPLDVNQDGMVSLVDALVVVNAINEVNFKSSESAIDTSGNGLLELLDALLVVNFLNLNNKTPTPDLVSDSEATFNQIRAVALNEHLARNFPQGNLPQVQLLVGFQPPDNSPPDNLGGANFTYEETVNQSIQSLVPPMSAILTQAGLREYSLGSSKLAFFHDSFVVNTNTMDAVNLLKVGRPRLDDDRTVRLEIVSNFGTPLGSSGHEYLVREIGGKWQVVAGGMIWIS